MDPVILKTLQTSKAFLTFMETSRETCVLAIDAGGAIVYCSAAMSACLGRRPEMVVSRLIDSFLTEVDAKLIKQKMQDCPHAESLLLNFLNADQHPQTLECILESQNDLLLVIGERPRRQEDRLSEELLHLNNQLAVLTRENIRKSRQLESALADLKEIQAMLVHEGKMAALGKMAAGVAHEVNNPISFVLNNHATLQSDFDRLMSLAERVRASMDELSKRWPEYHAELRDVLQGLDLDYLEHSIPRRLMANGEGLKRVNAIVQNLRNFARVDEGHMQPCDVADLVGDALLFLSPLLREYGVEVESQFAPLPELYGQPGALSQALSNIIINAIQASSVGASVNVSAFSEGGNCVIEVADHGSGIAPQDLNRIFDPFFTTKPVGLGTGLGLSISDRIVKAHHGTIRVESHPGEGTRMRIEIPWVQGTSK